MGYERYPRGTNPQGDYYGRQDPQDYGRDYGAGRAGSYSSAREYEASGEIGSNRDRGSRDFGRDYQGNDDRWGTREYGNAGYTQRDRGGYGQTSGRNEYHGSYAGDGRRFEDVGSLRDWDDDNRRTGSRDYGSTYGSRDYGQRDYGTNASRDYGDRAYGQNRFGGSDRDRQQSGNRGYGRQPQGYDYNDRGFMARAGDEVRSWFGDEDAERRREYDARYDERTYGDRDNDYRSWRSGQIASLDRDYDEYRTENRSKFENEFSSWRSERQGQRDLLSKVDEHMDVVGSDGEHVGTVDKVRGDRILLTKSDADAGGRHHSIPSRWLQTVDTKVTLAKTADEAKKHWRDEERNQAMFGDRSDDNDTRDSQGRMLNRSFSGTY